MARTYPLHKIITSKDGAAQQKKRSCEKKDYWKSAKISPFILSGKKKRIGQIQNGFGSRLAHRMLNLACEQLELFKFCFVLKLLNPKWLLAHH
jgi:hypothetical protein